MLPSPRRAEAAPPHDLRAPPGHDERGGRANVVLVGAAGRGDELTAVLSELLVRQNVAPEFERRERFRTAALLSENAGDARVWVFVTLTGPRTARLYFRGPYGNRFLLRRLSLKNGLDELGRELIAQVVETSTVALLRSEAGLSREEAKRDLSLQGDAAEGTEAPPEAAPPPVEERAAPPPEAAGEQEAARRASPRGLHLAARLAEKWAGGDLGLDTAIGLETGLSSRAGPALFAGGRIAFEYGLGQSIETAAANADTRTIALRAMADVAKRFGAHALSAGLGGGVDVVRIAPTFTNDAALAPSPASVATTPVIRLEGRYLLTLGTFRVTAGLFADVALEDTHYDVRAGDRSTRVAEPWAVRPGASLTLGWCPSL